MLFWLFKLQWHCTNSQAYYASLNFPFKLLTMLFTRDLSVFVQNKKQIKKERLNEFQAKCWQKSNHAAAFSPSLPLRGSYYHKLMLISSNSFISWEWRPISCLFCSLKCNYIHGFAILKSLNFYKLSDKSAILYKFFCFFHSAHLLDSED